MAKLIALLLVFLSVAPAQALDLCELGDAAAYKSPLCIRYVFECTIRAPGSTGDPGMSIADTMRIQYLLALSVAARNCEEFSYVEADAALSAKMRLIPEKR